MLIGYIFLHELTGVNSILLNSNQLIHDIELNHKPLMTQKACVYLIKGISVFAALLSILIVKKFERKKILTYGYITVMLLNCVIYILDQIKSHTATMPFIFVNVFIYQFLCGSVCWMYVVETTFDLALGIIICVASIVLFAMNTACSILME